MFDLIDSIVGLDVGGRGVTGLYAPARALAGGPVSEAAAKTLAGLRPGEHVFLLTGSLSRAGVDASIAENDGPIGVAALARAISYGFNAIPVVLTDASIRDKVAKMVELAGASVMTPEQADTAVATPRFTAVATVLGGEIDDAAAREQAEALLERLRPTVVISVERAGLTADGTYRNMLGQDYSQGRARLDHVVTGAGARGIPTVGVGDGGNEIGFGAIREAVVRHVPHGEVLCAASATDIVLPAGVSNWGCYAILAALALLREDAGLAHTANLERRLIEASPMLGLIDGSSGKLEPTVDGMPVEVHTAVVSLLAEVVRRGLLQRRR
jgi:D-glutamate cyclase